jgi:hypothetical protein
MSATLTPSRSAATLAEQQQIWQDRLEESIREAEQDQRDGAQSPLADLTLYNFAVKTEERWQDERTFALEMGALSRTLGGKTLDVTTGSGKVDTPQEYASAMVQIVKRLTNDNLVSLGQKPTANQVTAQNDEATTAAAIRAKPRNVLSSEDKAIEDQTLNSARQLYGDKDFSRLAEHLSRAQSEGYTADAGLAYVAANLEADSIASGRGTAAQAAALFQRVRELTTEPERAYVPARQPQTPADTQ